MILTKTRSRTIERGIQPPMKKAITLTVDLGDRREAIIYVCAGGFTQEITDAELTEIAKRLTLQESKPCATS